ncbi:uncharacterized protein METZ01_LOCUS181038, partial [marine metagenome]
NIYLFPATLNNFQLAQINTITGSGASDAVFLFGDKTKYGFFLEDNSRMIDMAWGNGSMGVLVGLDMNSETADDGTGKTADLGDMTINAAFGQTLGFGDLGVSFEMASDDGASTEATDDESEMTIGLNLRRNQSLWVFEGILVGFEMVTGSQDKATWSTMGLSLDLFNHWGLGSGTDLLFALGFGFASESSNSGVSGANDVKSTTMLFPKSTVAVETAITDWATARAGVTNNHTLSNSEDDGAGADNSVTGSNGDSDFAATFGLGFDYGGFTLDMVINPGFYTDPVSHITGFNDSSLGYAASITYAW